MKYFLLYFIVKGVVAVLMRDIFKASCIKLGTNGECWLWQGNVGNSGYGRLGFMGNTLLTHRVSYELFSGDIPLDKSVLHKCHNRLCVNPAHLYLGDAQDNARDWLEARQKEADKPAEIDGKSKLTTLEEIEKQLIGKTLHQYGQCRNKTAKSLGISTTTLWRRMKTFRLA